MNKGFLNSGGKNNGGGNKDMASPLLSNLAKQVRNIDGKIMGKDVKPLKDGDLRSAVRGVKFDIHDDATKPASGPNNDHGSVQEENVHIYVGGPPQNANSPPFMGMGMSDIGPDAGKTQLHDVLPRKIVAVSSDWPSKGPFLYGFLDLFIGSEESWHWGLSVEESSSTNTTLDDLPNVWKKRVVVRILIHLRNQLRILALTRVFDEPFLMTLSRWIMETGSEKSSIRHQYLTFKYRGMRTKNKKKNKEPLSIGHTATGLRLKPPYSKSMAQSPGTTKAAQLAAGK
ncbi:hypothetical protein Tco_1141398 [Tanacetum coccineum]